MKSITSNPRVQGIVLFGLAALLLPTALVSAAGVIISPPLPQPGFEQVNPPPPPPPPQIPELIYPFLRGDANGDGRVDISDIVAISQVVTGGAVPRCEDADDVNDDGQITTADTFALWSWLFLGGPAPAQPFPEVGFDPTDDALGCDFYPV